MLNSRSNKAKHLIVGRYHDWIKRFDANEYLGNRPMIEKLYEEKQLVLSANLDLDEEVKNLTIRLQEAQLGNSRLSIQLKQTKKHSFIGFVLSLLAVLLAGIGVNIVTDKPYAWAGWVMVVFSILLEIIAFFIVIQKQD